VTRAPLLLLPILLAACTQTCRVPLTSMAEWKLYMGGNLSPADWDSFARDTIEPSFPQGFTVLDASGAWKGGREHSRVLDIVAPETPTNDDTITHIAAAYRTRFVQESVGIVQAPVCAAF
jgi:Protein of unknown function (DUF3574)